MRDNYWWVGLCVNGVNNGTRRCWRFHKSVGFYHSETSDITCASVVYSNRCISKAFVARLRGHVHVYLTTNEQTWRRTPCHPVWTAFTKFILTTTTTAVLQPLYRSTCVSWHLQSRTGFCWREVLLPTCTCWWQPVHSDARQDTGVLLNSVIYTISIPHNPNRIWNPGFPGIHLCLYVIKNLGSVTTLVTYVVHNILHGNQWQQITHVESSTCEVMT